MIGWMVLFTHRRLAWPVADHHLHVCRVVAKERAYRQREPIVKAAKEMLMGDAL